MCKSGRTAAKRRYYFEDLFNEFEEYDHFDTKYPASLFEELLKEAISEPPPPVIDV